MDETRKTRRRRRVFLCLFLALAAAEVLYTHRAPVLRTLGRALVSDAEPAASDVIVVLGGGGAVRADKGAELFNRGFSDRILVTLPRESPPGAVYRDTYNLESLEVQSAFARAGVPPERVSWSEGPFYSTRGEAAYIRDWMNARGLKSALVVAGRFQSARARMTFNAFFPRDRYDIRVIAAPGRFATENDWWRHEEGIITVENEWIKTMYYWLRLTFDPPPPEPAG